MTARDFNVTLNKTRKVETVKVAMASEGLAAVTAETHQCAALFIDPKGHYANRLNVDAWPESRDAHDYRGPLPVVAHPPCAAWCCIAGVREARYGLPRGIDGGCFASALQSVFRWGGVLEHPAFSTAWREYGLTRPEFGGWVSAVERWRPLYWVTEVWQCDYGHRARKRTWLLYVGKQPPAPMRWLKSEYTAVISGCRNRCVRGTSQHNRVWGREASRTPEAFAAALIELATNCGGAR